MLKPSLQVRIGQSLSMTPQLQQAIRLLQLSSLELHSEIQQMFETNPMLERDEEHAAEKVNGESTLNQTEEQQVAANQKKDATSDQPVSGDKQIENELPVDSSWEDIYQSSNVYSEMPQEPARDIYETQSGLGNSLQDQLIQQLDMINLSDTDRVIGITLIDEIDNDGYLADSVENIYAGLQESFPELDLDEVMAVLHLIQRFDPIGSGACDLADCLSIQLQMLPSDTPYLPQALIIVQKYIDALGSRNTRLLQRKLDLSEDELRETINLIQSLNPRPGAQVSNTKPEYIIPDVTVVKQNGVWRVDLTAGSSPKLRINSTYSGMVKSVAGDDKNYMRTQLQEARWFIKSLHSRNETLLRVATAIVEHQRKFLEYGPEAMKPLVLRDIAEQLELHESTVSRVTTNKYMHTPKGIYEFKYFFSSHVGTSDGGMCSATAIRAMIKKLVEAESNKKPLSDSKIAQNLGDQGINVARRTVAKYREALSIPPSNERKQL